MPPSQPDKSPRTVSNGSSSANGSITEDPCSDPKFIKSEVVSRTDPEDQEDKAVSPLQRCSPKPSIRVSPIPSTPSVIPKSEPGILKTLSIKNFLKGDSNFGCFSGLRCHSCDIGFSHLSNLVAHKKFYCRGLLAMASGAERNAQQ